MKVDQPHLAVAPFVGLNGVAQRHIEEEAAVFQQRTVVLYVKLKRGDVSEVIGRNVQANFVTGRDVAGFGDTEIDVIRTRSTVAHLRRTGYAVRPAAVNTRFLAVLNAIVTSRRDCAGWAVRATTVNAGLQAILHTVAASCRCSGAGDRATRSGSVNFLVHVIRELDRDGRTDNVYSSRAGLADHEAEVAKVKGAGVARKAGSAEQVPGDADAARIAGAGDDGHSCATYVSTCRAELQGGRVVGHRKLETGEAHEVFADQVEANRFAHRAGSAGDGNAGCLGGGRGSPGQHNT